MGEWAALASALCFAIANVTIMRGATRKGDDNGAFLSLLLTAGIAALGWLLTGLARGFVLVTPVALAWFALAGVCAAFVGRVFMYASVQRLGAMRAAAVKRINPFFTVLLGVLVLGELITQRMLGGAALIVASFVVLISAQWRRGGSGAGHDAVPAQRSEAALASQRWTSAGYVFGLSSALGYASGSLLRKFGLAQMPDPFFGAMLGSLVGALLFVGTASFQPSYRRAVQATFRRPNPWLVLAGSMSSAGQILQFVALEASPMSTVALVSSMEVFMTIGLSLLFAGEKMSWRVALAAALGFAGTALIV